jgi:hypothetical protein
MILVRRAWVPSSKNLDRFDKLSITKEGLDDGNVISRCRVFNMRFLMESIL